MGCKKFLRLLLVAFNTMSLVGDYLSWFVASSEPSELNSSQRSYVRSRAVLSETQPSVLDELRPSSDLHLINKTDLEVLDDFPKSEYQIKKSGHNQLSFTSLSSPQLLLNAETIFPLDFDAMQKARKFGSTLVEGRPYKVQSRGSVNPSIPEVYAQQMKDSSYRIENTIQLSRNISIVLEKLLCNYDSNQRPGHATGLPAMITSNIHIRSMGPMSELNMEYSLDCYFRQKWRDQRLEFEGPFPFLSLNINMLEKIWKPDTYFHNGKGSYLHTITRPNKFLRIYKNGDVYYSMRLTIKARCPMQLQNFPMDKQSCPLIFGSYGYTKDQIHYQWDPEDPVSLNEELVMSQYDLINFLFRNGTATFKRGLGDYSLLQVNFNLRRHTGYFLIQVYLPCNLIVVLSWVSFWINREATADRIGLGITTVLTLSTFGLDTRTDLPKVSYPTALDWFVAMCFLFVVMTLLEFAGVHYFTKVGSGEVPLIGIDQDWAHDSGRNPPDNENPLHIITPPKAFSGEEGCGGGGVGGGGGGGAKETKYFVATPVLSQRMRIPADIIEEDITNVLDMDYNPNYCPKHNRYFESRVPVEYINEREQWQGSDAVAGEDEEEYEDYDSEDSTEYGIPRGLHEKGVHEPSSSCCWDFSWKIPKCCVQFFYCLLGSEAYREKMARNRIKGRGIVNSVSVIDNFSRIAFPVSFFLFNLSYFLSYGKARNSPFKTWE